MGDAVDWRDNLVVRSIGVVSAGSPSIGVSFGLDTTMLLFFSCIQHESGGADGTKFPSCGSNGRGPLFEPALSSPRRDPYPKRFRICA
jgi:hypothetical protein